MGCGDTTGTTAAGREKERRMVTSSRTRRSPTQKTARSIVRKYRRQVRQAELQRLKSVIPAVRENNVVSEVSIYMLTIDEISAVFLLR